MSSFKLDSWHAMLTIPRPHCSFKMTNSYQWLDLCVFNATFNNISVLWWMSVSNNTNPLKTGGEPRCSGRVSSSCSTNDTLRVNLVTNLVISHKQGKDREWFTTSGTYPWSFVIFKNM
jgi:hypothetical protein